MKHFVKKQVQDISIVKVTVATAPFSRQDIFGRGEALEYPMVDKKTS